MLGRLVEQHEWGRGRQRPGQQQAAALPAGDCGGVRADDRVQVLGQGLQPGPQPGALEQARGLPGCEAAIGHPQVLQDAGVEDVRILRGEVHSRRNLHAGGSPGAGAVNGELTGLGLQEPGQGEQEGCLADSRGADDGQAPARRQVQVNAPGHNRAIGPTHGQVAGPQVGASGADLGQGPALGGGGGLGALDQLDNPHRGAR